MAYEDDANNFKGFRYLMDAKTQRQYALEFVLNENGESQPKFPLYIFNGEPLKPGETVFALDDEQTLEGSLLTTDAYKITATTLDKDGQHYDTPMTPVSYRVLSGFDVNNNMRSKFDMTVESRQALAGTDPDEPDLAGFPEKFEAPVGTKFLPPHHKDGKAVAARIGIRQMVDAGKVTPSADPPRPKRTVKPVYYQPDPKWQVSDSALEEALRQYSKNLTDLARKKQLDPVIGREKEVTDTLMILNSRLQSSVCFTGDAGTGKTAMFRGVAQRLVDDEENMPEDLQGATVRLLDLQAMTAGEGSQFRGGFEKKLKPITDGLAERKGMFKGRKLILCIDEIHAQLASGAAEGSSNAGNMMKPMMATEGVSILGATTGSEYRRYIKKDAALGSRFEEKPLSSPDDEKTLQIMKGLWPLTKRKNHLTKDLTEDQFRYILTMTNRYAPQEGQPRKSEKVMNRAGSRAEFEGRESIERPDIIFALAQTSGLTEDFLNQSDADRFLKMEEELPKEIIGQPGILQATNGLINARAGLSNPDQPWGSYLLQGPTGTGKTQFGKSLARYLFGDEEKAFIKLDMADYQQEHDVSKITGAPPGYVGFEDSEPVTERIRRQPYCVLLLDEIEKAHPKVFDKFLAILNDGKITDNHGSTVLFNNVIILMTTNLGAKDVQKLIENKGKSGIGWGDKSEQTPEKLQQGLEDLYKKARESFFKPEMLGRIEGNGGLITFRPLDKEDIAQIAAIELEKVNKRLTSADRANLPGVTLELSKAAMQQVVENGYNPSLGARAVLKEIQEKVSGPLGKWLLQHREDVESLVRSEGSAKIIINELGRDARGWPTVTPLLVGPKPLAVVNDNAAPDRARPPRKANNAPSQP